MRYNVVEGSNNQSETQQLIEDLLTSSIGVRGLVNRLKDRALREGYNIFKNYFGVEHTTSSIHEFEQILKYFAEKSGRDIMKPAKQGLFPYVAIDTIRKIDENTIVYIYWKCTRGASPYGYFYIFGKHCYKHYRYIQSNILREDNDEENETVIYTIYASERDKNEWEGVRKSAPARPFSTLYFDGDVENAIKTHLDNWLKNKEIYHSRGITFKTGILLYGSPGTGKSSIAAAVAEYMKCNIILIDSATFKDLNINEVTASIKADDKMYVVLLDDIDVILTSRTDDKATTEDKAAISKLLGFLDSSSSPDNVIFIATTNHIELFDEAIKRAGRFDKIIQVENICKSTALRMCKGFGLSEEDAVKVVNQYGSKPSINPADLQVKILDVIKENIQGVEND